MPLGAQPCTKKQHGRPASKRQALLLSPRTREHETFAAPLRRRAQGTHAALTPGTGAGAVLRAIKSCKLSAESTRTPPPSSPGARKALTDRFERARMSWSSAGRDARSDSSSSSICARARPNIHAHMETDRDARVYVLCARTWRQTGTQAHHTQRPASLPPPARILACPRAPKPGIQIHSAFHLGFVARQPRGDCDIASHKRGAGSNRGTVLGLSRTHCVTALFRARPRVPQATCR